ncbi:hypothetical protein SAMN04515678_10858 [Roseivivax sediminis]|uniref:Peptidoglycan binding domain-containing protein n=2 Tax=Roseivivax sediminis TaxID=936889 RepID=A0A1I1Z992_9RHOB|nr:hypothetical protein SAMN04515678_10858 [Roseivivax sediminis]
MLFRALPLFLAGLLGAGTALAEGGSGKGAFVSARVFPQVDPAAPVAVVEDDLIILPHVDPAPVAAAVAAEPDILLFTPEAGRAALPVPEGLPEPALIVGLLPEAAAQREPAPSPDAGAVAAEVDALRLADPARFGALAARGVLDPSPDTLVVTLQRALRRLGCYGGAIDGAWGPQSRRGAAAFRGAAGVPGDSQPTAALYRAVLLNPGVTCPPVVAAPAAPSRKAAAARGGDRVHGAAPARQAAPARRSAPAPAASPRIDPSALGIGVFR